MVSAYLGAMVWSAYPSDDGASRSAFAATSGTRRELASSAAVTLPSSMSAAVPEAPRAALDALAALPLANDAVHEIEAAAAPSPCPAEMVHIGRYCIDRYEAHLVVVDADGRETLHPHHQRPPNAAYQARSRAGVFPQGYISRIESQRACERAGKRLCTWLEWRRGCQGRRWADYPSPGAARQGACNTGKTHLLGELFGRQAGGRWDFFEHFNSPKLNQQPGYLAASGEYRECGSEEGVYDAVGNLHEWVATSVSRAFMAQFQKEVVARHEQPWRLGNGIFMGGFYSTGTQHGKGCYFTTIAHDPKYHDYSTGFRCCSDAREEAPATN
jgi:hypothetical protein